jgi:tRNA(Ile)-lysidine synthase
VHHGIRGKSADADARFVAALAKKLSVSFILGKFNVPAEAKKTGESLEMAARRVRRGFLLAAAKRRKIRWIAVGHTADDQAETVLLRIARGTSITGLAGIPYATKQGGVMFVRPLRDMTRREIVSFLKSRKQVWREDESNATDFARRNRVRHEILPLLERRLNPGVRQALLRLADIAAAEDEVMSALAKKAKSGGPAPLAIRRRRRLAELRAAVVAPEKQVFHSVETFFPLCGKTAKKFSIVWKNPDPHDPGPGTHMAREPHDQVHGVGDRDPHDLASWVNEVDLVPRRGGTRPHSPTPQGGGGLEKQPTLQGGGGLGKQRAAQGGGGLQKIVHPGGGGGHELTIRRGRGFSRRTDEVCLSAVAVGGRDLVFRSWHAGDRMQPLGMTGSKKLSDIFTDLKVPRAERNARIVLECSGEIAALAGWRVSRDFAVEGPRAPALRIRFRFPGARRRRRG